jgi:methylmalonyl-CoA mutase
MTDELMVLAGDFDTPTMQDWDREVLKALNKRRPPGSELTIEQARKRLTYVGVDGVEIDPLYVQPDNQVVGMPAVTPFTRGSAAETTPWIVAQLHEDGDIARTTAAIQDELNAGGTGVWLRVDADAISPDTLGKVLAGVKPEAAPVCVSSITQQADAADALLNFFAGEATEDAAGNLGIDPMAQAAVTGEAADLSDLSQWVRKAGSYPNCRALTVDVTPYDNASCGDIDQLAFAIATGIEYVRELDEQGVDAEEAFDQILFRVAVTADEFLSISRVRALRRLWARVGEVLKVPENKRGAMQHAVTSWRIMSKDDPWVNLLRTTVGAFSAGVGGVEIMTVLPHDTAYGLPTKFSRRIARNIQLVNGEEAHVGRVKDPAGGAWTFEALTEQLAEKAWARVQEIETLGGMSAALAQGKVAEWIKETCDERCARLATRKIPLTGVSMFPKEDEAPLTDFIPRPPAPKYGGIGVCRDSAAFEVLRDRARTYEKKNKTKPTVVLACLGDRRDFGAREQFTQNLLLVGGIGFDQIEGPTPAQIVEEAKKAGTSMVILASSASVYAEQALDAAKAAKDAGLTVWLAGKKTEIGDGADAVIDGEIFDGMDVVAFLGDTLDSLGVAK